MSEELFFTVSVMFLYKKISGLFLPVGNVLNQIRNTAIKVSTDSVKVLNVQTFPFSKISENSLLQFRRTKTKVMLYIHFAVI